MSTIVSKFEKVASDASPRDVLQAVERLLPKGAQVLFADVPSDGLHFAIGSLSRDPASLYASDEDESAEERRDRLAARKRRQERDADDGDKTEGARHKRDDSCRFSFTDGVLTLTSSTSEVVLDMSAVAKAGSYYIERGSDRRVIEKVDSVDAATIEEIEEWEEMLARHTVGKGVEIRLAYYEVLFALKRRVDRLAKAVRSTGMQAVGPRPGFEARVFGDAADA